MHDRICIRDFSSHVFWDVDRSKLDLKKDSDFIIERVVAYGRQSDEILLHKIYSYKKIKKTVTKIDYLSENTIAYLSAIFKVKKERFKCFGKKPLHWI
ncbi:MAG: hypothetical protein FWG89_03060 [Treponema sp.]|nr:hypothetical protein [Treponema sp.]